MEPEPTGATTMATDAERAQVAGMLVNEAQGYLGRALRALDDARSAMHGTPIAAIERTEGGADITGRDISISITELEGVLLRLKHGTPGR